VDAASLVSASAEEAAAIGAALSRFVADTAPPADAGEASSAWLNAARAEAVERLPVAAARWS
jgi:hypothetical protein